jgi:REP element-mobilizing transposase RayT
MPYFDDFPHPSRYNTLRLLGYDYSSTSRLCAITLVADLRRPVFADIQLAKSVLACLLSEQTLALMRLRAFTLMPNHLHLVAGVRIPEADLSDIIASFKSYTTRLYWKRSSEIVRSREIILPSICVSPSSIKESQPLIAALIDWRATVRPEVVNLKNWPLVKPELFLRKRLWQTRLFDHVIRNDFDLRENLEYVAMNPVREGYVAQAQFYPFTGFYYY